MKSSIGLKKRYTAKLSANIIGLVIGVATEAIIPRGLGPKAYGDFNFLSNFFSQLMDFFSLSTSTGFYTKLSQRQREFSLISFYFMFTGLAVVALFAFIAVSQLIYFSNIFWEEQNIVYVYMAAVWAVLIWIAELIIKISDAYGLTVSTEIVRAFVKFFGLVIIMALFFLHNLNLFNYFFYHYCISILLICMFVITMKCKGHPFFNEWGLRRSQIRLYIKEFYEYSQPLFIYSLVAMIIGILDRWLLQKFGGSIQQGFFGISYRVGVICFLFTSAMTSLITREFSIAYKDRNLDEMARLFRNYVPSLYSITAFFGCFACAQASKITYILGGAEFTKASLPVAIMAFYPVNRTYGQLTASVFYASGKTKLYRNIGVAFMLLGVPFTYYMLAPKEKLGLDAGAMGLAVKFVLLQIISVNFRLYYISRLLHLRFKNYLGHQLLCAAILICIAFLCKMAVDEIEALKSNIILEFILSGVLYTLIVAVMLYFQPIFFGFRRAVIMNMIAVGKKRLFMERS